MKRKIDNILEKILVFLLGIMLISVIWQVFSRYILQSPSTITDELSSFSLIWLGILGAAYVTGQKLHLAIDLIPKHIIEKRKWIYDGIVFISVFLFAFFVMVVGGIRLCLLSFQFNQTSAALEIPLGIVYLIIPISGITICYYSLLLSFEKNKTQKESL